MSSQLDKIRNLALERFEMESTGIHGLKHWERVLENGLYLCKHCEADEVVVGAFAYLHDSCRQSDGTDPDHGARAALFASTIRNSGLEISDDQFLQLATACELHDKGRVSKDPTVGACWDADRLDLGRVGIRPRAQYLSTDRAKKKSVIEWAYKRSRGHKARLKA